MNTKIGTSFGLALLVAIAAIATMFALGMFSAPKVGASHIGAHTADTVGNVRFVPGSFSVNSKTSWDVTIGVSSALTAGSGTIEIKFPDGVVLPSTIDKSRISVGPTTFQIPLTSDPTVSGTTVTLTVPATDPDGTSLDNAIGSNNDVTIRFSQLAGIVNPAKSGAAGTTPLSTAGKVKTSAQATNVNIGTALTFTTSISLSKTSAAEGDTVVVTLGGFTPGLTVSLSGQLSGSAVVGDDRKATIDGTMKTSGTDVVATDTAAITASKTGTPIALKATLTVTATGKAGDTVTLTGKNFTPVGNIAAASNITFGGIGLTSSNTSGITFAKNHEDKDADTAFDDFSIKITIPSGAKKGTNQIKVTDSGAKSATATIEVEGRTVTIDPTSGPPGTVVTVNGAGFPASRIAAAANTITINPFGPATVTNLFTNGSGALPGSDQFTIPTTASATVITLTVSIQGADLVASTGTAKFTVTSRVLTVVPDSGPRGTKVLITGTKFTGSGKVLSNKVTVDGKGTTHAEVNLTSAGDVPGISLDIPKDAGIGSVTISLEDNASTPLKGTTKFTITVPTIALGSTSATMGEAVQVTGEGWVPASSVTITVDTTTATVLTKVATADSLGAIDVFVTLPSTVGVGTQTVTFTAKEATFDNTATAQTLSIPKPKITLSVATAVVGDVVTVEATGFIPSSGLSILEIGGADVRSGVQTSNTLGALTTTFTVPGLTGSQIVKVKIGGDEVSTSLTVNAVAGVAAAETDTTQVIFADLIASDDNLVRVWRFNNADQSWQFFDPRPAFEQANTLLKSGAGDIVWVNVTTDQEFQGQTLVSGWNLIVLK